MQGFRAAVSRDSCWRAACAACLGQLGPLPAEAGLGFVYASGPLAHALDLVIARLRVATGRDDWVGSGGLGVAAGGGERAEQGALAVLLTDLPAARYRLFDGLDEPAVTGGTAAARYPFAVVHGDPQQPAAVAEIAGLSERLGAFLVGGLTSASDGGMQVAGRPTAGGLSGVLLSEPVGVISELSQGCSPIGPAHAITACEGPWIASLDGAPALDVLEREVGELLTRAPARLAGFILAARPAGPGRSDYLVRDLGRLDPARRRLTIGDEVRPGETLMFVKRDAASARHDLGRMLAALKRRSAGRAILGGLYHSCVARGQQLFGSAASELGLIGEALGGAPIVGAQTHGEIFRDRLHGYAGVLTLFLR